MRIVLTGGPGSGKTTVAAALAAELGVAVVAESATAVYTERAVNWLEVDDAARRELQEAMYRRQVAEEAAAPAVALLDRGTIDGAAYWPDGPVAFFEAVGTTQAAELARYDAVLLLESAAAVGAYDGAASNAARFEDAAAAIESGRVLRDLWRDHPHLQEIPATQHFNDKLATIRTELKRLLK